VPTTEGVTTHSQLAAAVADPANSVVVVEGDVQFPSFSVITVVSGRSVSVVGRSAVDGGRVVLDGGGWSQHFWVTGGTLHITFVNLVNGTSSQVDANCRPDLWKCSGGSILVQGGGTLVMRSCDVIGGGPGVSEQFGNAFMGAGVFVEGAYSAGDFYNCSFTKWHATYHSAIYAQGSTTEENAVKVRLAGCTFSRNSARYSGVVCIGWSYVRAEIYDCIFENNDGMVLVMFYNSDSQIGLCTWTGYGSAVVIAPASYGAVSISDSVFERNIGDIEFSGGALTLARGAVRLENVSFIANTALPIDGGAALDVQSGARVTASNCFALANVAVDRGAGFVVYSAMLTVINSTFAEQYGNGDNFYISGEETVFAAHGSVFRDNTVALSSACFISVDGARGSLTDCLVTGNVAEGTGGAIRMELGSTMSVSRTTFRDNHGKGSTGCFLVTDSQQSDSALG
jgi:hypothetical protein